MKNRVKRSNMSVLKDKKRKNYSEAIFDKLILAENFLELKKDNDPHI